MTIHERLLTVRKNSNAKQGEFSKRLGVSRSAYINYERGDRELPSAFLLKLHAELSINPTWLLTGQGPKTSVEKGEIIEAAVVAVQSFALLRRLEIDPERTGKLVLLLVEYFEEVGGVNIDFANKLLETQF